MKSRFTKTERRKHYEDIICKDADGLERGLCFLLSDIINLWCYYGCRTNGIGEFPEFDTFIPDIRDSNLQNEDRIFIMQLCIEMTK